jgi:hypothetical protein
MKLVLEQAAAWPVVAGASSGGASLPHVLIPPMEALTEIDSAWKWQKVGTDMAAGCKVEILGDSLAQSSNEWPVHLIDAKVHDTHGALVEERLTVIYVMMQFAGIVILRTAPGKLAELRAEALPTMLSGRLDTSEDNVGIASLNE